MADTRGRAEGSVHRQYRSPACSVPKFPGGLDLTSLSEHVVVRLQDADVLVVKVTPPFFRRFLVEVEVLQSFLTPSWGYFTSVRKAVIIAFRFTLPSFPVHLSPYVSCQQATGRVV